MPELPEVETIKLGLQRYLVGHTIEDIELRDPKVFQGNKEHVIGQKVTEIERFGKGIVIDLSNGYCLAIHIKLTGQIVYVGKDSSHQVLSKVRIGSLPNQFTHIIFKLDIDANLYYNDARKFGWVKVIKRDELKKILFFKELGKSLIPSEGEEQLTEDEFRTILSKSGSPVKVVIMDQKKIAGIGNIYANDGLYLAGIDPRRPSKSLSKDEVKKLYDSLFEVFRRGLRYGGASELNFVNALGEDGKYQEHFLVYARKGKPCLNCSGKVQKIYLGGRGTFFCEECQK